MNITVFQQTWISFHPICQSGYVSQGLKARSTKKLQGCIQGTISKMLQRNLICLPTLNTVLPKKMAAYIGGCHLQIKEQQWLAEKVSFKLTTSVGCCHLQSKEQFWLVAPSAIVEEPFALCLNLETSQRQTLNADWAKKHRWITSESTLGRTLNAAQVGTRNPHPIPVMDVFF